ncbi:MAG: GAF domain-containing protein [Lewinellaceae bacterium]|nr:hypothetical protein [Saprospiraceae bacterium]MCB9330085.1 GAF domain-containing protein [Lewinellaceae bacterium]
MKQVTLEPPKEYTLAKTINSVISFQPFYRYLQQRIKMEKTVKVDFYNSLIRKIEAYPELKKPVKPEDIGKYRDLLELIYAHLTGITTEENETLWGLGPPRPGPVFYGTDSCCNLFAEKINQINEMTIGSSTEEHMRMERAFVYSLILERYYDFKLLYKNEMTQSVIDKRTKLSKYYRVNVDTRFIEISHKGNLPALDFGKIDEQLHKGTLFEYLMKVLPLRNFTFTGFNIVYFTEFTEQYAIQLIRNMLLDRTNKGKEERMVELVQILRTIAGCIDIGFGFIPFVRLNEKLILDFGAISSSVLLNYHKKNGSSDERVQEFLEEYVKSPLPIIINNGKNSIETTIDISPVLSQEQVVDYALLPLYNNSDLIGVLEVYAKKEKILGKKMLLKIDPALSHIAQLMKIAVDDFNGMISRTVTEKFTSIQPAVHWRFKEAAWNYLYDCLLEKKETDIESIAFEQLYPLYGAVDIRNSSVERNHALEQDLRYQLTLLSETFAGLKKIYPMALLDKMIFECGKWLGLLNPAFSTEESIRLTYFLDREAQPALDHFKTLHPDCALIIDKYSRSLDETTGKSHLNRRNLEVSTQMITKALDAFLDNSEQEMQKTYPFFFEKYRTDGVEYDMFVGQALAPHKRFDRVYLSNLRLWQLQSMATISQMIRNMHAEMPKLLEVTLLIYVNSDPIDIHFRKDEKRFDVEGGYNVRYQMIKKRIDKVHIQDTDERLTQPDKIALVYTNKQDAAEYISHIRYLQQQHILNDDLEELELEELQGVSGLKALRVGVRQNNSSKG